MKKTRFLVPLLLASGVMAQDQLPDLRIQNSGGTVMNIRDVKLLKVEPDGLRVLHAAGTAKVPYELLPDDLQLKYGFTAAKAEEHRAVAAAATQPVPAPPQPVSASAAQAPRSYAATAPAIRPTPTTASSTSSSTSVTGRFPTSSPSRSCSTGTCGSSVLVYPQSGITSGLWGPRTSISTSRSRGNSYLNRP